MSLPKYIYNEYMNFVLLKLEDKLHYYERIIHSNDLDEYENDYYIEEREQLKAAIDKIKSYSGKWHY